jgi:simple sugar transport system permease protein
MVVFALLYIIAAAQFPAFRRPAIFGNFFSDNAFLGVAAVGMTFVILSGGIDLSVGAIVGMTSILVAVLIQNRHFSPLLAVAVALVIGTTLGAGMGAVIRYFKLPPFLVTLAGMFLARGSGFLISVESVPIKDASYARLSEWSLSLGPVDVPATTFIFVAVLLLGIALAHGTKFGRNVYALGGDDDAANLMGLPVGPTRLRIYAFSGFCSALAGVVYTIYSASGNASAANGLELDAIASVVIGGTLLTGGVGYVAGTLMGVLIFGIIQTYITFLNLSSWWTKIAVGVLLLFFVLIQKVLARPAARTS